MPVAQRHAVRTEPIPELPVQPRGIVLLSGFQLPTRQPLQGLQPGLVLLEERVDAGQSRRTSSHAMRWPRRIGNAERLIVLRIAAHEPLEDGDGPRTVGKCLLQDLAQGEIDVGGQLVAAILLDEAAVFDHGMFRLADLVEELGEPGGGGKIGRIGPPGQPRLP